MTLLETPAAPAASASLDARRQFLDQLQDEKARELIATLGPFDYDLARLFPKLAGFGSRRDVKRRITLLKGLEPRFEHLLYPGEQVRFVTTGTLSSLAEQYFLGIFIAALINRTVFLFTNYRVLLINAGSRNQPKQMQWQIPYDEIGKFVPGNFLSGAVVFKLNDKKVYKFSSVPKADRRALREFVQEQVGNVAREQFRFPHYRSRDGLCPACSTPAAPRHWQCTECGQEFINPRVPALLSLALPGLGDMYLGHFGLALLELLGYAIAGVILLGILADGGLRALPLVALVLAIEHALDAALTYHIAGKGIMLKSKAWKAP